MDVFLLIFSMLTACCLLIAVAMFGHGIFRKTWYKPEAQKATQITVIVCAATYLLATLFAFMYFVNLQVGQGAEAMFWAFLLFYFSSILLNIYIWIQRLEFVYIGSAYGFSVKFMKFLKIYYAVILLLLVLILLVFAITGGSGGSEAREGTAVETLLQILFALWALLFAAELIILCVTFTSKLRSMYKIAQRDLVGKDSNDAVIEHQVQSLLYLQMKLTILVCVQVISSLLALFAAFPADGDAQPAGMTLDAFCGFLCVYCTLKPHDNMYSKLCFCCIACCNACYGGKAKQQESERDNVAVASATRRDGDSGGHRAETTVDAEITVDAETTVDQNSDNTRTSIAES